MKLRVPERLESERMFLRQFEDDDWRDLHLYYSDAEAMTFTQGRALSEGETWRVMCSMIGHWQLRGYGPYALEQKSSGKVLGTVGLWYPNNWPEAEIKWGLARRFWGRGFASEAASLVLASVAENLPGLVPISMIHDDNSASIALALALGARRESSIDYEGEAHGIYRHKIGCQASSARAKTSAVCKQSR
jgi:RimJ/RimL family protein N-acetyltransferase